MNRLVGEKGKIVKYPAERAVFLVLLMQGNAQLILIDQLALNQLLAE
ncbi:hypothetical protein [Azonexus sp. R2A61]